MCGAWLQGNDLNLFLYALTSDLWERGGSLVNWSFQAALKTTNDAEISHSVGQQRSSDRTGDEPDSLRRSELPEDDELTDDPQRRR